MKTVATRFSLGTLLLLSSIACAQAADPAPDAVLTAVRARLQADTKLQASYTCVQNIKQQFYLVTPGARPLCSQIIAAREARKQDPPLSLWDRVRLDVGVNDNHATRAWPEGSPLGKDELKRLSSQGPMGIGWEDFAGFSYAILIGREAQYTGKHADQGRTLYDYSFEVSAQDSQFKMSNDPKALGTAHGGTFVLDPENNDIVELMVRTAELPENTGGCQLQGQVKFHRLAVASDQVLIPQETRLLWVDRSGNEATDSASYQDCREMTAEAKLRSASSGNPERGQAPGTAAAISIPAGVPIDCRIVTGIDSDTAAAGDLVDGVLRSPIRVKNGPVIVPKGARVHGRLRYFAERYQPHDLFQVGIRLESIEVNGVSVPLHVVPALRPQAKLLPMDDSFSMESVAPNSFPTSSGQITSASASQMPAQAPSAAGSGPRRPPPPSPSALQGESSSGQRLEYLPTDVEVFSLTNRPLRLDHLDSYWMTTSPANSEPAGSSGSSGTMPAGNRNQ